MTPAHPKPSRRPRPAVKVYFDDNGKVQREVCNVSHPLGRAEYFRRLGEMVARQGYVCVCGSSEGAYFGHEIPRGNGGSTRDDRILHDDGTWRNAALCYSCNSEQGSKRYAWVGNPPQYVPVTKEAS